MKVRNVGLLYSEFYIKCCFCIKNLLKKYNKKITQILQKLHKGVVKTLLNRMKLHSFLKTKNYFVKKKDILLPGV